MKEHAQPAAVDRPTEDSNIMALLSEQEALAAAARRRLHRRYLLIIAALIVMMFLLPKLHGRDSSPQVTAVPAQTASAETYARTRRSSDKAEPQSTQTAETEPPAPAYYIGNKKSKIFHRPDCGSLPVEKNQVIFDSRDLAVEDGYSPCGRCNP